jgi:spore germination protein GerM
MRRVLFWLVVLVAVAAGLWWTQIRPQTVRVSVYFVGVVDGAVTLVPVERAITARGTSAVLRGAYEALLAGPAPHEGARGLATEIPAATRLRGVTIEDGVATVDLSDALGEGGGSMSMQARVWQIVYTGTQLGVRQVRIVIDGAERTALGGEGVLIDRPLVRPPVFPRF